MYASEIDGDYYTCACGESKDHSYLLSSSDGDVKECCKGNGWDYFEHRGVWRTKKPHQTKADVIRNSEAYSAWYEETDWSRYYKDRAYQEERGREFEETCR